MFYSLQAIRAIAALLVVLQHATNHYSGINQAFLGGIFAFGYCGVDFFFVLSGLVISLISWNDIGNPFETITFVKKRLVRIYPPYWLFLFLPLFCLFLLAPSMIKNELVTSFNVWESFLLIPGHPPLSQVSWTLGYEIYFYFLFSLIIFNKKFLALFYSVGIMAIINLMKLLITQEYLFDYNYPVIDPIVVEFFLGVFIGRVYKKKFFPKTLITIGSAILIYIISIHESIADQALVYRTLFYGLPSALIIYGLTNLEFNKKITLSKNSWLVSLGAASYTLYLIHSPILSVFDKKLILTLNENYQTPLTILLIILITLLSVFIHRLIEIPMTKYLQKKMM